MVKLELLIGGLERVKVVGDKEVLITNIAIDSRQVNEGGLFFAIRGTRVDGHDFINQVIAAGAKAVVCEAIPADVSSDVTFVVVKNASEVVGPVASAFYNNPSEKLKVIGVTGTNGKTTTVTLLYNLHRGLGLKCGLISTVNYIIDGKLLPASHTTPDAITLNRLMKEMLDDGCEYCFMEVSSHSLVQNRVSGLKFSGAVFTNITRDHLDYHGTFAEYLRAKKLFFDNLEKNSFALINLDDRNSRVMVQNSSANIKTYALKSKADFTASVKENLFGGMCLNIQGKELWTSLIGNFNAYNLLAVFGTSVLLGAEEEEVLKQISSLLPVPGRFETILSPDNITVIIDYAHTPDALNNVIDAILQVMTPKSRLITVIGAGGDRDRGKRPLMGKIASGKSDLLILTSDNPRSEDPEAIIREIKDGVDCSRADQIISIINRAEAIKTACLLAGSGDFVLVAGKGHETYQEINGVRHHFDDKEEVNKIFENMQKD